MSNINTLKKIVENTIFEKTMDYLDNIYNVFTAFNGLQSINSSINDTKDILNKSSNDKSSQEYQDAKNKLDSLIVERNAQSLSLASSMTALIKTHNSDSNFANFGLNATQSISNGAIFVERLTRSNVGSDGRQVDISLAIDILSTSLKAIISGVQAMDDIVADATKGIAKKNSKALGCNC